MGEPGRFELAFRRLRQGVACIVDAMTALYQRCAPKSLYQVTSGLLLGGPVFDGHAGEELCFRDVRGNERCEREETRGERCLGIFVDKPGTAGRNHHGIDDNVLRSPVLETIGDRFADLYRRGADVLKHHVDLVGDDGRVDILDAAHAAGILRGDGRDSALGKQPVRGDGLDIRLDACPSARIGTRDGQDGWQRRCDHGYLAM